MLNSMMVESAMSVKAEVEFVVVLSPGQMATMVAIQVDSGEALAGKNGTLAGKNGKLTAKELTMMLCSSMNFSMNFSMNLSMNFSLESAMVSRTQSAMMMARSESAMKVARSESAMMVARS
jgi:hypothetical protein